MKYSSTPFEGQKMKLNVILYTKDMEILHLTLYAAEFRQDKKLLHNQISNLLDLDNKQSEIQSLSIQDIISLEEMNRVEELTQQKLQLCSILS